jgi:hypothetical protein
VCRESERTTRAVFEININKYKGYKINLSGSVQAHRVSRIPGGDFRRVPGVGYTSTAMNNTTSTVCIDEDLNGYE